MVKHFIVIVLDVIFKHALWPNDLDLDFALQWLCHYFMSSLAFSAFLWSGESCECQTLQSNCPRHTLQARIMTRRLLDIMLEWLCHDFTDSPKVSFSAAVIAASVKPCIVITLNIIFKHVLTRCLWPRFRTPVALSWFYLQSSIKLRFSEAWQLRVSNIAQ